MKCAATYVVRTGAAIAGLSLVLPLFSADGVSNRTSKAAGPLRVHPTNPRYFTDGTSNLDGSLKAIYLTGSHTWANLIDRGASNSPAPFDFNDYLKLLQEHGHNFIRLWGRQVSWYHDYGEKELHAGPLAWSRTGPGLALDGKPKFDLRKPDAAYFERLRGRVAAARKHGIFVSIMLFGGQYDCRGGWRGNPFHPRNNINDVNGDPSGDDVGTETFSLAEPEITRIQEAYVRRVIEAVNDLDNVLYEIANEADESSIEWQHHMVHYVRACEAKLPKQHPVGMTALSVDSATKGNEVLARSPADWVSFQFDTVAVISNLSSANGAKVSLLDSDHWFVKGIYNQPQFGREWVWKAFTRGHQPILMEHLPPTSFVDRDYPLSADDPGYRASRRAMGQTRRMADRMNLAGAVPMPNLATTGYCLANPGREYLVYQPRPRSAFSVVMIKGRYAFEWFHPAAGAVEITGHVQVNESRHEFIAPYDGDAALYLQADPP